MDNSLILNLSDDYDMRVYAGWLGKCIGVHFGGPIEGWTYQKIRQNLGFPLTYLQKPGEVFKPDDDLIMPLIMMTALAEKDSPDDITPEDLGNTWRNLLSKERGGIWRGGYGISSEHTALLNLNSGIQAPFSGSAALNGKILSEQIGGQIFSDIWGLVLPKNQFAAANLAEKAACVSHDGEGINGGRFIAALVSNAFQGITLKENICDAIKVLPDYSIYKKMVLDLLSFYDLEPNDWEKMRDYIEENWGYDRFSGLVPIIPNAAVIVLALLYGQNDFSQSIRLANVCGWDTDCNVGNVGAVLGVTVGFDGIEESWRKPLNDFVVSASVQGSKNISIISNTALFLADCGHRFAGDSKTRNFPKFHFGLPGATQGFCYKKERCKLVKITQDQIDLQNITGKLKVAISGLDKKGEVQVYTRTHFMVDELNSNNYEASFSPSIYPGQVINSRLMISENSTDNLFAALYVYDRVKNIYYQEPGVELIRGKWIELNLTIPRIDDVNFSEAGMTFVTLSEERWSGEVFIDSLDWQGTPNYRLNMNELLPNGKTVLGWTIFSGYWRIEEGSYTGSGIDYNESNTCDSELVDYDVNVQFEPLVGYIHCVNIRVQGGLSSYAIGLIDKDKIGILKKINGSYTLLFSKTFPWTLGQRYDLKVTVLKNTYELSIGNTKLFRFTDENEPYNKGQIGLVNGPGCCTKYLIFQIGPLL